MQGFNSCSSDPREFSFHRSPADSSNRHNASFGEGIKTTLLKLPHAQLIDICLDSFDQNEYLKAQHYKITNQSITFKSEISQLKSKMQKKRQNIRVLVQNHNKITRIFQKHMKVCNKQQMKTEEYWEKKFKELEYYMNSYVIQNNQVQEEYLKNYNRLKDQNERIYIQISTLNEKIKVLSVKLKQDGNIKDSSLNQLHSNTYLNWNNNSNSQKNLHSNIKNGYENQNYQGLELQNQKLKKQILKFNQQRQELEVDIGYLHEDMQRLKQKINALQIENQTLKADIHLRNNYVDTRGSKQTKDILGGYNKRLDSKEEGNEQSSYGINYKYNYRKKHILIPPLKIQQSLQKIKQIQRSHSAAHL